MFEFTTLEKDRDSDLRLGRLTVAGHSVPTPAFMAVGTQATVKSLMPAQVQDTGTQIVLGNTYHLMLRPGAALVRAMGGLHRFMAWDGVILTDSGGYQVFSLADLCDKTDHGVVFRSHIDGSRYELTPERSIEIQMDLGADILMAFDDCVAYPCPLPETRRAMDRTTRWASRCLNRFEGPQQALFGIVQGGMFESLREESAQALAAMPFDGFGVGGLSVGEPKGLLFDMLELSTRHLPEDKPRYLMGVGTPADLVRAVALGVDMFDCVLPTRNARNGYAFTSAGIVRIKQARYRDDSEPLDPNCSCETCRRFSRAYLHHIYRAREILASVALTLHNLTYYQNVMAGIREAVEKGTFSHYKRGLCELYGDEASPMEAS